MKLAALAAAPVAAMALAACATPTAPMRGAACGRACLEGALDAYLDALIANDPSQAPFADDVVFVENYQRLDVGEGTWATMDGRGVYAHVFADPASGNVGLISTMRENGVPVLFDLRLKVENGRIAEAESFVIRSAPGALLYENTLGEGPAPEWLEAVPEDERLTRAELVAMPDAYFSSMQRNDGGGDYSFFHPECNRLEHAVQTTNMDPPQPYGHIQDTRFTGMTCAEQWSTGFLGFVTDIRDRRHLIVDEERQALFSFASFDHNGAVREIELAGAMEGDVAVMPPYFGTPRTLQVLEAFLVRDGKLFRIEMTLLELPYGAQPPWPAEAAEEAAP